jgi:ribosomal protein S8
LELLKHYGFVKSIEVVEITPSKKLLTIHLKPVKDPIADIPQVKFFSKPSRAWYVGYKDIHAVAGGKGLGIISTSQ